MYSVLELVNFAHGSFYVMAGYLVLTMYSFMALPYPLSLIAEMVVTGLFGAAMNQFILAYCAAERFCEAIDKLGPDDKEALRAYLRDGEQETALGTLTFVDGDADRPTVWLKYDKDASAFKAVTEIPANE